MKDLHFNNLPSLAVVPAVLDLVRRAYGPAACLVFSGPGPYFYSFRAVFAVPGDVDGWPALVNLLTASGRGDWIY